MMGILLEKCGLLFWPQMALSIFIWALFLGYLIALLKGDICRGHRPWEDSLSPLGGLATMVGLCGSVIGFVRAFGAFQSGIDVSTLAQGLSVAYWTTGVGIVSAVTATLGSYILNQIHKRHTYEVL